MASTTTDDGEATRSSSAIEQPPPPGPLVFFLALAGLGLVVIGLARLGGWLGMLGIMVVLAAAVVGGVHWLDAAPTRDK